MIDVEVGLVEMIDRAGFVGLGVGVLLGISTQSRYNRCCRSDATLSSLWNAALLIGGGISVGDDSISPDLSMERVRFRGGITLAKSCRDGDDSATYSESWREEGGVEAEISKGAT